jgi:hypothetical protein
MEIVTVGELWHMSNTALAIRAGSRVNVVVTLT